MKRHLINMILFTMLTVLIVLCLGLSNKAYADSPKRIYTIEDLYSINSDMSGDYILMNDIDMTAATAAGGDWDFMGNGWEPIGSGGKYGNTQFTGTLDGNGHSIKGLNFHINDKLPGGVDNNIYIGLFANNAGVIKNLNILYSTMTIIVKNHVCYIGGIAAYNTGTIKNCYCNMDQNFTIKNLAKQLRIDGFVGGLIGCSQSGLIDSCGFKGEVNALTQGNRYLNYSIYAYGGVLFRYGGIAGRAAGTINNCASSFDFTGSVKMDKGASSSYMIYSVGGIVGGANAVSVANSYYAGSIAHTVNEDGSIWTYNLGGLDGALGDNGPNTFTNCYVNGVIDNGKGRAGCGEIDNGCQYTNCFSLSNGSLTENGITAATDSQMKLQGCFTGFDFNDTWFIDPESDYPYPQLKGNRQDNKEIELVELKTEPTTKEYYPDSDIDPTGGTVKVYYKDGTNETKTITKTMLRDYDMSTLGEQDVTVNYRDFTVSYKINVVERPEIETLTLISEPDKKEFVKGTRFDFTGCKVQANYVGGESEIIDVVAEKTDGGNINQLGNQTISFSLLDRSVSFTVKVIPVEVESIEVAELPNQTTFVEGKPIDTTGLKIKAIYNNGEEQIVTGFDIGELPTAIGKHDIEVKYSECTTSFEVEIIEKSAVSISIKTDPSKTEYVIGQELDPTGMVVEATFDNDDVLEVTDYTIGALPEEIGYGRVEIEYQDKTAYVTVAMRAKTLESITVKSLPNKTKYIQDETFDKTGLVVEANYNNGNSIPVDDYTLSNTGTAKVGTKSVVVLYEGITTTFDITIVEKKVVSLSVTPPTKTVYIKGDELDKTGMIVNAVFDNGKSEEVEDYTVSGFDESDEEANLITVTYKGMSRSFLVTIHDPETDWRVVTPATCTTSGEKSLYCKECNELLKTEEISALGHSWSEWESVSSPSCVDKGSEKRTCSICNEVEYKDIDSKGHTWESKYTVDKEATCQETGIESIHCSVCGLPKEGSERVIEVKPHSYGGWNVAKDVTCTENGREERICSVCSHIDAKDIVATGHDFGEWKIVKNATCTENGIEEKKCSKCDTKESRDIIATGHEFGEWQVVKRPTCTEKGVEEKKCSKCQDVERRDISETGHVWDTPAYVWSPDNSSVIATRVCNNNHDHIETEIAKTSFVISKPATYTAMGQTTYTATFTNLAFGVQKKTITDINKLPKKAQKISVKAHSKKVQAKALKKKAKTIKVITVKNAQGKVSYKLLKGNAKSKKALKLNKKTGKITVKKKTKKGTYKITVRVNVAGTVAYKPAYKNVKVTVKVR